MARLLAAASLVAAALAVQACTDASTSVAAPTAPAKCQISATNQPSSFPHDGGRGSVTITATRDCTWSVSANAQWVAISGASSGQGEAVVDYTVSENPVPSSRAALLAVESVQLPLSQEAAPCRYALAPGEATVGAAGGTVAFAITTLTGCAWSAASEASWISVAGGGSGSASATVGLTVAANPGAARQGTVFVGGQRFVVNQERAPAAPPAPPPAPPAPAPTPPAPPPVPPPAPAPPPPAPAPPPPAPAPPPPAPAPPPPAPSPPPPERVEFEGRILAIDGSCPEVGFYAAGRVVVTNAQTDYKKGRCRDLSWGDRVKVRGTTTPGKPVTAERIEFEDDDEDDDDDDD